MKPSGYVIYRGPSLLNGDDIVVVAILRTTNTKTGSMVQTYILRCDTHPGIAAGQGSDIAICGMCPQRPSLGGKCYVNLWRGPAQVWKAFTAGKYPAASPAEVAVLVAGRQVRLGAYGDPAAVPAAVWETLLRYAAGHTGYTHQWGVALEPDQAQRINALCMASVGTPAEASRARQQGLRYFRSRRDGEPLAQGEFVCPASHEAGKKKTCAQCGACDGSERPSRASPVIVLHGMRAPRSKMFAPQL